MQENLSHILTFLETLPLTQRFTIDGIVGDIELLIDRPDLETVTHNGFKGFALVAHPHPLFGGTMDNKVAQTLAKTFNKLGYLSIRSNFRGVGKTQGEHDHGIAEQDDLQHVMRYIETTYATLNPQKVWVAGGFSFGTVVLSHLQKKEVFERLILTGTAAGKWNVADVPQNTIIIHGEQDETIPLNDVFEWARPQKLPIVVFTGADHFFHQRLIELRETILQAWK